MKRFLQAELRLRNVDTIPATLRKQIVTWLKKQARDLERDGKHYDWHFRAKFLAPKAPK